MTIDAKNAELREQILAGLQHVVTELSGKASVMDPDARVDQYLASLGFNLWDSLEPLMFIFTLERTFGITIDRSNDTALFGPRVKSRKEWEEKFGSHFTFQ